VSMVERTRRELDWRENEPIGDAVRRLTAMIDERNAKKRRLAGAETPAEIQDFPWSPGKNAEERSHKGSGRLDAPPQRPAATSGEEDDGVRMGGGRAAIIDTVSRSNGCARPDAPGSAAGSTDRADTRPGGL
jgi:hypothetical protein